MSLSKKAIVLFLLPIVPVTASCDVEIAVQNYRGQPRKNIVVKMESEDGRILSSRGTGDGGVAQFCDIGLSRVRFVVGTNTCGQIVIGYVSAQQGKQLRIPVFYENCHSFAMSQGCTVLLRVRNSRGSPIRAVRADDAGNAVNGDEFGRVYFGVLGSARRVLISAPGYRVRPTEIACGAINANIEADVVLTEE